MARGHFLRKPLWRLSGRKGLSKESLNQVLCTGIEYSQAHDEKIIIHQTEYTAKIEPLRLPNMSKNHALDALEVQQFKSLVGQLQWTAKQTRPDIAVAACEFSTKVKDATTTGCSSC